MNNPERRIDPGTDLPIAVPPGSLWPSLTDQVTAVSAQSTGTNTPPPALRSSSGRVGARALDRLDSRLSERDHKVLALIAQHRYLTTAQLQAFAFIDHASNDSAARTSRRVLARLEREQLIRSLGRRIGGVRAGSSGNIWQLAPAGARLLRDDGVAYRTHEPSQRFLGHCLAVADAHLMLHSLKEAPTVTDVTVAIENEAWHRYNGSGGEARWLQPDLFATIRSTDYDDHWFIEVDLGTESLPTLLRKCGQYEAYRASGIEQAQLGVFPMVLWVFNRADRIDKLMRAVARSHRLDSRLFVATHIAGIPDKLLGGSV